MGDPDPDPDDLDDFVIPSRKKKKSNSSEQRFRSPVSEKELSDARKVFTPPNTAKNYRWAESLFLDWLGQRNAAIRDNGSQKRSDERNGSTHFAFGWERRGTVYLVVAIPNGSKEDERRRVSVFDVAQFAMRTPACRPRAAKTA